MDSQDYPISHFDQMGRLAAGLKAVAAQVLEHTYSYESFGSWAMIIRYRGQPFRVLFDGKEYEYLLERSTSREQPYRWQPPSWQKRVSPVEDICVSEIVSAIDRGGSAG
jgi:hypothetical protein